MASFAEAPPGNPKAGEKIFKTKCAQCHTVEKGAGHKQGTPLLSFRFAVFGFFLSFWQSLCSFVYLLLKLPCNSRSRISGLFLFLFDFHLDLLFSSFLSYCTQTFLFQDSFTSKIWLELALIGYMNTGNVYETKKMNANKRLLQMLGRPSPTPFGSGLDWVALVWVFFPLGFTKVGLFVLDQS